MYQLNTDKVFFDMADGQAVAIDFTTGIYYGTSALGSAIMERLTEGVSTDALIQEISSFPGCPDDFKGMLDTFVARLVEKEILISGDTRVWEGDAIPETASAEGFGLPLDEFSEVQDLILADPVHDVDVEAGWPFVNKGEDA